MNSKNKKIVYGVFGITLLMGIALLLFSSRSASSGNTPALSGGVLKISEASFDFGTISMAKGKVSHRFEVKNEGSGPVNIEKVYTSCMCTEANIILGSGETFGPFGMPGHFGFSEASIQVPAGEAVVIEAVFDPAAHGPTGVGLAQRSVYLETNSAASPRVEVKFQATVTH